MLVMGFLTTLNLPVLATHLAPVTFAALSPLPLGPVAPGLQAAGGFFFIML